MDNNRSADGRAPGSYHASSCLFVRNFHPVPANPTTKTRLLRLKISKDDRAPSYVVREGSGGEVSREGAALHVRHGPSCRLGALGKVVGDGRAWLRLPASLLHPQGHRASPTASCAVTHGAAPLPATAKDAFLPVDQQNCEHLLQAPLRTLLLDRLMH